MKDEWLMRISPTLTIVALLVMTNRHALADPGAIGAPPGHWTIVSRSLGGRGTVHEYWVGRAAHGRLLLLLSGNRLSNKRFVTTAESYVVPPGSSTADDFCGPTVVRRYLDAAGTFSERVLDDFQISKRVAIEHGGDVGLFQGYLFGFRCDIAKKRFDVLTIESFEALREQP